MPHSRYQSLPTHPLDANSSCPTVDEGPLKWWDRICSSFPVVMFFSLLLVAIVLALSLTLSLSKTPGVFIENSVYSATCIDNLCRFGFSEYPRDISCINDGHCSTYVDTCASNPCALEGTEKYVRGPKGGYVCLCKERYEGPLCEKKLHPCDYRNPCFAQATCVKHPTEVERYSCQCPLGWMGTHCEYRSQIGDTCVSSEHCSGRGECLQRSTRKTCHCALGYHGLHCLETVDVDDCLGRPCVDGGHCIDKEEGYICHCKFGRSGKRCQKLIGYEDCGDYCKNGGKCDTDPSGLPICKCEGGYGGDFCTVLDVSRYRLYKGGATCQCHSKHKISLQSLKGRWFLLALKKNTYNPPDACVQLSVIENTKHLKNVQWRNDSLAIRYLASRNDTSSHHKVERVTVDETETMLFAPQDEDESNTSRLVMVGSVARLYAFPVTKIATHDNQSIEFGVVYSTDEYLVLHSCTFDKTHGYFDALLILSKQNDNPQSLETVLKRVYNELPYVTQKIVMVERSEHCKD